MTEHTKDYRVRFVYDQDAEFEECNGERRPLTESEYKEAGYQNNGVNVTYTEYLAYYGNPDRHVYLACIVDKQCACCDQWRTAESLWNIDMMDDDPSLQRITIDRNYTLTEILAIDASDYLASIAREVLADSGYQS